MLTHQSELILTRKLIIKVLLFWAISFSGSFLWATEPLATPDLYDIEYPEDEPPLEGEISIGKKLFFDALLSDNKSISCATCHNPNFGFGDGLRLSRGSNNRPLKRHTPHLYNLAWASTFFWDGRVTNLEQQVLQPISNPDEMNLDPNILIKRLNAITWYQQKFASIYGSEGISEQTIGSALAAFLRSLITNNAPFDRYLAGDTAAMGPKEIRGEKLFEGKAMCHKCHDGANFTDDSFHSLGIATTDTGRGKFFDDASMNFRFKTPSLRNIELTAPYMHDGSLPDLESVLRFYNDGGGPGPNLDSLVKPLMLTPGEISDLLAFLAALTDPIVLNRPKNTTEKE